MYTTNQQKGIAFKNFRRFKEFPMLEFGDITYMVGRNNSGKSTMVKALLLTLDYLQNQLSDTFSFDNLSLEDANIVTFGRAKCNLIDEPEIVFNLNLNDYNISIHISGNDDRTKANVDYVNIVDEVKGYTLKINYLTELVQIIKKSISNSVAIDTSEELQNLNDAIKRLTTQQNAITNKGSKEALQTADQINKLVARRNKIAHQPDNPKEKENIEYNLEYPLKYQEATKLAEGLFVSTKGVYNNKDQDIPKFEVDLGIQNLTDSAMGMTNFEMLNLQLQTAKRQLEFVITKRIPLIVFIGVGKGVLHQELDSLFQNYDNVESYEADAEIYGVGATEVFIDYNINNNPRTEDNELKEIISVFLYHNSIAHIQLLDDRANAINDIEEEVDSSSDIVELDNTQEELKDWINQLVLNIDQESFVYLGANPSKQSALFSLRAKDNALAQAIHEFHQLGIQQGDREWEFVKKWMSDDIDVKTGKSKGFEVGNNFKINFFSGEAYEFKVIKTIDTEINAYSTENHLSDKGMGSLQAMLLILRVASLIRINKKNNKSITLLVEEPELNLHPALQSKLTDFFHEVNKEFGFNFIVETHSEYIVRRSQLLALENDYLSNQELNPNPFSIFYFHKKEGPYKMEYNEQGKFNKDFGPGFYDEAGNMTLKMIKELRKNQSQ